MGKLYIKNRYGQVPVELLNRPDISLRAKGLFAFLQSKPDGWAFSVGRIAMQTKEGKAAVRTALQELEKAGYLVREPCKNDKGQWAGYDYYLFEKPSSENRTTDNPSTDSLYTLSKKDFSKKDFSKKDSRTLSHVISTCDNNIGPPLKTPPLKERDTQSPLEERSAQQKEKNTRPSLKERVSKYLPLAERLAEIIQSAKNVRITTRKLTSWADEIRKLVEYDGVGWDRVERALDWYAEHIGGEFVPVIESGKALRDKFLKLEGAMQRKSKGREKPVSNKYDNISCVVIS